jgi:hypothetical protein
MVESDRELLELAAKAAGIKINTSKYKNWNPLNNNYELARLEVACRINSFNGEDFVCAESGGVSVFEKFIDHNNDRHAARRRASTVAAAMIGKYMG